MSPDLKQRLRERSALLGLNQTEAAKRCGVARSVFSRWVSERQTVLPSMDNLPMVAAFLDVQQSEVFALYPPSYRLRSSSRRTAEAELAVLRSELTELRSTTDANIERLTGIVHRLSNVVDELTGQLLESESDDPNCN